MLEVFNLENKRRESAPCDVCGPGGADSPVASAKASIEVQTPQARMRLCHQHAKLLLGALKMMLRR